MGNKSAPMGNVTYTVTFRIKRECGHGESLCVLGSIPELGNWKEFKHHLRCKGDNVWESITPVTTHSFYFQYKYSLMTEKGTKQIDWEKGVDRLADLVLMPDQDDKAAAMRGKAIMGN